ncbi:hypothetical protein CVT25_007524 [Psilocybe cyanescens]|uniref:NAD-dependent epimerase/dehydratase domain-containing protein n=1 Tax=Psilocybe cyanescens TaxID=93625 RepID=A0A409XGB2_PSICY|nr:hypothetical protein CVT25_007524 [Psilocybe cyanescens]
MPAVLPVQSSLAGVRVLVSGANGFIALHVVKTLLEQGYIVRGTVRSEEKGRRLEERFREVYGSKFEWIVVEDIAKDGAFDDAVRDVDAIQHVASPAGVNETGDQSPDVYIKPAVQGTLGILRSALKFGHNVKRIILTSSTAAIWRLNVTESEAPVTFDETNWCDDSLAEVRERGSKAPMLAKYSASKALSEKAAWEFYHDHQKEVGWDLVALLPAMVPLTDTKSISGLPDSLGWWFRSIFQEQPDAILGLGFGYVDVVDCAAALVAALQKDNVGGERIIISAGPTTFQDTRNLILSSLKLSLPASALTIIRGNPSLETKPLYTYNAEKGKRLLELEYREPVETYRELVNWVLEKGWLNGAENDSGM